MDFKELQQKIVKNALEYGQEFNIKIDEDFALLKLYEEMGEFAQAVLIHRKKCRPEKYRSLEESKKELTKELADVIGVALVNAHLLNIDIEEALKEKWLKQRKQ